MKRFFLDIEDTIIGNQTHEVVYKVQNYLLVLGYLKEGFTPKLLDVPTQEALKVFQHRRQLPETGEINQETAHEMEAIRCGMPDVIAQSLIADVDPCTYRGRTELTYAFSNFDVRHRTRLAEVDIRSVIAAAFQSWAREIRIPITEQVDTAISPDFKIGWFSGGHSVNAIACSNPFDDKGNFIGHAFDRCPDRVEFVGQCHFDLSESWVIGRSLNTIDIQTQALHEIGHLLGIKPHLRNPMAVMVETYQGLRRELHEVDKAAIRRLYRLPFLRLDVLAHFEGVEVRRFKDNEFTEPGDGQRRMKGFQLSFSEPTPELKLRYMAHIDNSDSDFVEEGNFIGSSVGRIGGFAIELTGLQADKYNVFYMAKIQDFGPTPVHSNGSFCGDRFQSKPVEAILVRVEPKP